MTPQEAREFRKDFTLKPLVLDMNDSLDRGCYACTVKGRVEEVEREQARKLEVESRGEIYGHQRDKYIGVESQRRQGFRINMSKCEWN